MKLIRRHAAAIALLATLCGLAPGARAAATPDYRIGPVPAWVQPVVESAPKPAALGTTPGGERWWLVDRQVRVAGGQRSTYVHTIVEAVTEAGVAEAAKIEVAFDPSYAALTLHDVRIWRDGRPVSHLADAQVKVLQRETDLESRIYDGRRTASLVLPDVRPGDAVEVAYTVNGRNPVFGRHEFGAEDTQWEIAVAHVRYRLLLDDAAALRVHSLDGAPQARRADGPDGHEYVWEARDVAPLRLPSQTPSTYQPYARVAWTDFADWGAVARWAEPLYQPPATLGPALQAERDRIAAAFATPRERASAVLRLVQEQVRYLGVEMGANSHAPSPPDLVFKRRYGDCKEKALLAVTLLRALGIDASPALVDTERRSSIATDLPSPESFDHVILRARIAGTDYWLDATREPQRGALDAIEQSDYGLALVLDGRSTDLASMPPASPESNALKVRVDIDLTHGEQAPATMQVTTSYRRGRAEDMRARLEDEGLDAEQDRFVNFYARIYGGVRVAAPMEVHDDPQADALTLVEHYEVSDLWHDTTEAGRLLAELEVPELYDALERPSMPVRRAPLELGPAERVDAVVVARVPLALGRHRYRDSVDDPAFQLVRNTTRDGDRLTLDYAFRRTATSVEPAQMQDFVADLDRARDLVDYHLRVPRATAMAAKDGLAIGAGVVFVLLLLALWWWREKRSAAARAGGVPAAGVAPIEAAAAAAAPSPVAVVRTPGRAVRWGSFAACVGAVVGVACGDFFFVRYLLAAQHGAASAWSWVCATSGGVLLAMCVLRAWQARPWRAPKPAPTEVRWPGVAGGLAYWGSLLIFMSAFPWNGALWCVVAYAGWNLCCLLLVARGLARGERIALPAPAAEA